MASPQTVLELIERFDRSRTAYRLDQYNEARLRIEFLNPFFEALGWNVNNKQGYAVEQMPSMHKHLAEGRVSHDKTVLRQQIIATDK